MYSVVISPLLLLLLFSWTNQRLKMKYYTYFYSVKWKFIKIGPAIRLNPLALRSLLSPFLFCLLRFICVFLSVSISIYMRLSLSLCLSFCLSMYMGCCWIENFFLFPRIFLFFLISTGIRQNTQQNVSIVVTLQRKWTYFPGMVYDSFLFDAIQLLFVQWLSF